MGGDIMREIDDSRCGKALDDDAAHHGRKRTFMSEVGGNSNFAGGLPVSHRRRSYRNEADSTCLDNRYMVFSKHSFRAIQKDGINGGNNNFKDEFRRPQF